MAVATTETTGHPTHFKTNHTSPNRGGGAIWVFLLSVDFPLLADTQLTNKGMNQGVPLKETRGHSISHSLPIAQKALNPAARGYQLNCIQRRRELKQKPRCASRRSSWALLRVGEFTEATGPTGGVLLFGGPFVFQRTKNNGKRRREGSKIRKGMFYKLPCFRFFEGSSAIYFHTDV